jgi:hypothetical protein
MKWYWKARIYHPDSGHYGICQFETERVLNDIDVVQDFYFVLTGAKMLLEGMSEQPFENVLSAEECFRLLFKGGTL